MTLEEFASHLRDIDSRLGYDIPCFNTHVVQIASNHFAYIFDGLLDCETIFHEDGTVSDIVDTHSHICSSIEDWKTGAMELLGENK